MRLGIVGPRTAAALLRTGEFEETAEELRLIANQDRFLDILVPCLRTPPDFPLGSEVVTPGQSRKSCYEVTSADSLYVRDQNQFSPYEQLVEPLGSLLVWGFQEFWQLRDSRLHARVAQLILGLEQALGSPHTRQEVDTFTRVMCKALNPIQSAPHSH